MRKAGARRTRVTRAQIAQARQSLLVEQAKRASSRRGSFSQEGKYPKSFWKEDIYCDSYGWCWGVDKGLQTVCLGKIEEVFKAKDVKPAENEFPSCHSATKNRSAGAIPPGAKILRATFLNDRQFLQILDGLIRKGDGLPTIRKELEKKGFAVPYRTLGRWVNRRRTVKKSSV